MFIKAEINERYGHHHNSLYRQRDCNFQIIKIDTVNKKLGIATKKKA